METTMLQDAALLPVSLASDSLDNLRQALLDHPIYAEVNSIPRLKLFMEDHVFAVWDFMSLLKRLQRDVTCIAVPWFPADDAQAARLINEIVLGEECDVGPDGETPFSHLELYLLAMDEVGADATRFREFCRLVQSGMPVSHSLIAAGAPPHVRVFVEHTIRLASLGTTEEVLGGFLYGREDIIPDMFQNIRNGFWATKAEIPLYFDYYACRHIELDGDSHGPLGKALLARITRGAPDKAERADEAAAACIQQRIDLWTGTLTRLRQA
jgi:hypothetical protein